MSTKSSHISAVVTISVIVFFTFAAGTLRAELVAVDLGLSPPVDPINVLTATMTLAGQGRLLTSTENTDLTGNVTANLAAQFSPTTHQVTDIDEIEFTGGNILFSDMSFVFSMTQVGTAMFTLEGLSGYLDTLVPPGTVSGGSFIASEHVLTLNNGVCRSSDGSNAYTIVDFSVTPLAIVPNGTGSIAASLDGVAGDQAIYNVALTVPMDYSLVLFEESSIEVELDFAGTGTLKAEGQFSRTIPEPATVALLALGCAALIARRRA